MKIETFDGDLLVSGITIFDGAAGKELQDAIRNNLSPDAECVEIDLSKIERFDAIGIGCLHGILAIVARVGSSAEVVIRNPVSLVEQILLQTLVVEFVTIKHGDRALEQLT